MIHQLSNTWIKRFLEMAQLVSTWSRDPSTKCGAVITKNKFVVSVGFNGFPQNVCDDENMYHNRETKLMRTLHGEENAILSSSMRLYGCSIFSTHFPCSHCSAKIIQVGIKEVYVPKQNSEFLERWKDSINESMLMFSDAKVSVYLYDLEKNTTEFYTSKQ